MTRELLLTKLKTKFSNLGLGEGILGAQADYLLTLSPTEENVDSLVDGMETVLKSFQSDLDKARAKKAETKPDPKPAEPNPNPNPNPNPKQETVDVPEWAKALIESNKAVADKLSAFETEKVQRSYAEKAIAKLNELGVKESFYKLHVSGKQFQNEEEIETFAQSLKETQDSFLQDLNIKALEGRTPPVFGETKSEAEVSPDVKARIDAKNQTT